LSRRKFTVVNYYFAGLLSQLIANLFPMIKRKINYPGEKYFLEKTVY